jgi:PAS domain S-box-containing protein
MTNSPVFTADERLLRLIVQASPAGMLIANGKGQIVIINEQALHWLGYEESELLGEPVDTLIPAAHRAAHESQRARYMSHPETRPMAGGRDLYALRKDGSEFPVDISLHPLKTEAGVFVLANMLDATARRQAELHAQQKQAIGRLALLGQLAGTVAHEIRTPLCVIRNDVYFLETLIDQLGPDGAECIEEINQAVGKAERIVNELLDFTREHPSHPLPVTLDEIVAEAFADYPIPPGVSVERPPSFAGMAVYADREQIARVLTNLLRNAVQAMQGAGRISIQASQQAECVVVEVQDEGPGIPEGKRESVFEPLVTGKPNGIGLGLAIAKRYARQNQGDLVLVRCPKGALFRLTLPRVVDDQSDAASSTSSVNFHQA